MKLFIFSLVVLMSSQIHASGCDSQFERWAAENVTTKELVPMWLRKKNLEKVICHWGYIEVKFKSDPATYVADTQWTNACDEFNEALQENMDHKLVVSHDNVKFFAYDNCEGKMDIDPIISGQVTIRIDGSKNHYDLSFPFFTPDVDKIPTF